MGGASTKTITESIGETYRESGLMCRYSGEEFVVLLQVTQSDQILVRDCVNLLMKPGYLAKNKSSALQQVAHWLALTIPNKTECAVTLFEQLLTLAD